MSAGWVARPGWWACSHCRSRLLGAWWWRGQLCRVCALALHHVTIPPALDGMGWGFNRGRLLYRQRRERREKGLS